MSKRNRKEKANSKRIRTHTHTHVHKHFYFFKLEGKRSLLASQVKPSAITVYQNKIELNTVKKKLRGD